MESLRRGFNTKIVSKLNLEGISFEAIGWCNERNSRDGGSNSCKIVIVGGSRETASALYSKIKSQDSRIIVEVKRSKYKTKHGDYIVNLDEIKLRD